MQHQQEWNKHWKTAEEPAKQRKYRSNAPIHVREKFLRARLSDRLQSKIGVKTAAIRVGDTVEVMRGDWKGIRGEVTDINYDTYKVFVDGVEIEANDGTQTKTPVDPSNLLLTDISLKDDRRLKHADEAGRDELVQQEEEQEAEQEEAEQEEAEQEEAEQEEGTGTGTATMDPESIVAGTVSDAKDKLQDFDGDLDTVLEAEKQGKNRKTLIQHIEKQQEQEDADGDTQ